MTAAGRTAQVTRLMKNSNTVITSGFSKYHTLGQDKKPMWKSTFIFWTAEEYLHIEFDRETGFDIDSLIFRGFSEQNK